MDAVTDPRIPEITFMASAQVSKTEGLINNTVGYHIDQDPAQILVVLETEAKAEAWSRERLTPMLKDTPCLNGKVRDSRGRDSSNKLTFKEFPGGYLAIAGAGSEGELSSRPIRIILLDELDKYKPIRAGDPETLAINRTNTFWNRKIIRVSTPRDKHTSRILSAYDGSDKRKYHVPCPHCGEYQVLIWGQLKFRRKEKDPEKVEHAWYECASCRAEIDHSCKPDMLEKGQWRAEAPFNGHAGFWINEIYSPWVTWKKMAEKFLKAKKSPDTLKAFVNESLAEAWEEEGETVSDNAIFNRREDYGPDVPMGVAVLTAFVDVQDDRIEMLVRGWGKGEESHGIEHKIFPGNPGRPEIWADLDLYLAKEFRHEAGLNLKIACTLIDTGGHHTQRTYDFIRLRQHRRIYGSKGANTPGKPIIAGRPSFKNKGGIPLFFIGTDTAKTQVYGRLKIEEFGPGYMHYHRGFDEEYFKQLTAEKIITKYRNGFPYREWVKIRARNEALDMEVGAVAALEILKTYRDFNLDRLVAGIEAKAEDRDKVEKKEIEKPTQLPAPKISKTIGRSRGGWLNKWRS